MDTRYERSQDVRKSREDYTKQTPPRSVDATELYGAYRKVYESGRKDAKRWELSLRGERRSPSPRACNLDARSARSPRPAYKELRLKVREVDTRQEKERHEREKERQERDRAEKEKEKRRRARDEIQHFPYTVGMALGGGAYRVDRQLGDGTFGRVLECTLLDRAGGGTVAVKVIRQVKKYAEAAKIEAQILRKIKHLAPNSGCVELLDTFQEGPYYCLVFETLGQSLYDFLRANKYRGYFMSDIQSFVHQVLKALAALHKVHLTHTDLKLENVLLVHSANSMQVSRRTHEQLRRPNDTLVKLIDFGGSTFANEHHSAIINTRQYRAPEVTLALGWDEKSDLWSAGCLAAELYTGRMLFTTHDSLEHLAMIEAQVGVIPPYMCERPGAAAAKYVNGPRLRWPGDASAESRRQVAACQRLEDLPLPRHAEFGVFLRYLLRICPLQRPTAREASKHAFFSMKLPE